MNNEEKIERLSKLIQKKLGIIGEPRFSWSLFPEWKEKLENWEGRDSHYQKLWVFLRSLVFNKSMQIKLINSHYCYEIERRDAHVDMLNDTIYELNKRINSLADDNSRLREQWQESLKWRKQYSSYSNDLKKSAKMFKSDGIDPKEWEKIQLKQDLS